ncbi:MAG: hypothetical protein ABS36_09455 [Acidobacteria bacterium SCN 69-37]|nr:MAG: hypothetical protein ABS36_09455 [Acidobacteria bacterium SCN 69-37]
MSPNDFSLTVGNPDQWRAFGERNRAFFERLDNLTGTFRLVFTRDWASDKPIDHVVFSAGFLAIDDFLELLLVCGNAEAAAAQKLLRPMFERLVTLKYLAAHPEELDLYLDYHWIAKRKFNTAVENAFGPDLVSPETKQDVNENVARVKANYTIQACDKCSATKLNFTWSPKDMITMAREVGMDNYIVPAYYIPMQFTHPTVAGMLSRLQLTAEGFSFTSRFDPDMSDRILSAGHALALEAIKVQVDHFQLDQSLWTHAEAEYIAIWQKRPDESTGNRI